MNRFVPAGIETAPLVVGSVVAFVIGYVFDPVVGIVIMVLGLGMAYPA